MKNATITDAKNNLPKLIHAAEVVPPLLAQSKSRA